MIEIFKFKGVGGPHIWTNSRGGGSTQIWSNKMLLEDLQNDNNKQF